MMATVCWEMSSVWKASSTFWMSNNSTRANATPAEAGNCTACSCVWSAAAMAAVLAKCGVAGVMTNFRERPQWLCQ